MSKLDKLLEGVDVEWKTLGGNNFVEIANSGRKPVKSSLRISGKTPYYGANNIQDFVEGYTHEGTYILIAEDGSASLENYSIQWANGKFWANNHVHVIRGVKNLDSRYLFHYLTTVNFIPYLSGGGRAKLTKGKMTTIPIPIPCPDNPEKSLKIQKEIVRILDTFTALTTELTTELTARKKQFNYYREQLLTFKDSEVKWKSLGEVVLKTSNIKWSDTDKTYRYIDLSSVCRDKNVITKTTEIRKKNAPSRAKKIVLQNDVIFATTRPTQMRLCLITEEYSNDIASTGYCVLSPDKKSVLPKWIFFCVSSNRFRNYVEENQSGSAYPAISDAKVKDFKIPIPPLEQQQRIVNILDKFDILTTSISEGLPKEIELRQKQYEYYRNKLLTFSKPS
ncbi:restriction endonuclease subunit S [Tenacibaculum maritimum]|uniref:restriction endonuclease subunit S n=1 Tax=Tenacibaculum maritimum TaxID=107401 RepID=UPI0038774D5A